MRLTTLQLRQNFQSGQMLVEVLMTIGIAAIILPALLTGLIASRGGKAQEIQRSQAVAMLKETEQAVRAIKNNDWTAFAALSGAGAQHPVISGTAWTAVTNAETIGALTRKFTVTDVYRDASGDIVTSGGTDDPSTKEVTITISWNSPSATTVTSTSYLTRTNNFTHWDTTTTDFNQGTATGTAVLATVPSQTPNDGQVQLGAGGAGGDWCYPGSNVLATFDLPGQGVAQAITAASTSAQNLAYTTTGGNASGDSVDEVTVSHASTPVIANPYSNNDAKAYGIFVDQSGTYLYFNENNSPNHTVQIANASNLSDLGYFDVSHTTGTSIYVSGNTGYVTAGSTLYSFDVSSKTGSRSQLGSVALAGAGQRVVVVGTNAYVATNSTTSQLQIINVSNPSSMSITKSINLGNSLAGVDVFVNSSQTYAYIVTSYSVGKNDFYIVDLTNTNNKYGYQTINGMNPTGIEVVSGNRAILVGSGGEEYEVFNISNPAAATHCGGMTPSGVTTIYAVAPVYFNGLAYSYIITNNSSAEFQIVLGGSGSAYSSSGTYESATFDAGFTTAFNRFVANISVPVASTLSAQVAVAPPVNNSCTNQHTFTYVGPGGTTSSNDHFVPSGSQMTGIIPLTNVSSTYQNPGRCFRYKLWYSSTDSTQSPELYDMTINYSP